MISWIQCTFPPFLSTPQWSAIVGSHVQSHRTLHTCSALLLYLVKVLTPDGWGCDPAIWIIQTYFKIPNFLSAWFTFWKHITLILRKLQQYIYPPHTCQCNYSPQSTSWLGGSSKVQLVDFAFYCLWGYQCYSFGKLWVWGCYGS